MMIYISFVEIKRHCLLTFIVHTNFDHLCIFLIKFFSFKFKKKKNMSAYQ